MTFTRTSVLRICFLVAGFASFGCEALDDLNRTGGNSKKGYFAISPEADLAVGATLKYSVGDYETVSGSASGIGLKNPKSDNVDVASIKSSKSDGMIEVKGVKAGKAAISFTAQADGEKIDDQFSVTVVKVTKLSLAPCMTNGVYARGKKAALRYKFNDGAKRDVLGLGYYPFSIRPESDLSLDKSASDQSYFSVLLSGSAATEVTISSSVSGDDSKLVLSVVDESDIDAVAPLVPTSTVQGSTLTVDLRPLVNGRPLCSNLRKVLRSINSYACTIDGAVNGELDTTESSAIVSLNAVDACQLFIEYPEVNLEFPLAPIIVTESSG